MEFALVAAVLFMVVFGTIQFGIAYNRYQGLHAAAREGARLGSLRDTTRLQIVNRVKESVSIVNSSSLAVPCPGTLGTEAGCVNVYRVTTSGAQSLVGTDVDKPCSGADAHRVLVEVKYRMQMNVSFVATFTPTATGTGDFVCE